MYEIRHYLTADGQDVFISRFKQVRDGVWELRVHIGPGYRIYYAHAGLHRVLLLGAGDKHPKR